MEHRASQLILPFESASPDRRLILAPRVWPTMTPRARQQLAKRVADLLRSALIAADARALSGGPQDEHAVQFAKSTNDGSSRQATLHLRAAVDRRLVRQHQESAAKRTATSVSGHQAEPTHRVLPNLTASSWRHSHISERMLRSRERSGYRRPSPAVLAEVPPRSSVNILLRIVTNSSKIRTIL